MTEDDEPGAIGPFIVRRKLGEGGMGVVYEGFDVSLDRKVALKLIRRQMLGNAEVRARMLREAQAMARVSHPNVVQVYQVAEHGDEIYVAMEYVEGKTLSAWLAEKRRPWPMVMRTLIAAGRGLAAAHEAGLVHRDFKPDNVLVGRDGRPRVVDFGLVHTMRTSELVATAPSPTSNLSSLSRMSTQLAAGEVEREDELGPDRLTQAGSVLGTPAYMSPEQHFGDDKIGAASDQFSFSVTLYEALYGVRPFVGATLAELKRAVRSGVVPPPPRSSPVPKRVYKILVRGLAATSNLRWPRLNLMLDMLERDPRKFALQISGVATLAGAVGVAGYLIAGQRDLNLCQSATQELAEVWDEGRASLIESKFAESGSPLAADTWKRVRERLDAYTAEWIEHRTQACKTHADGSLSTRMFDLRTACLLRRRSHLSALLEVFASADRSVIENAVQASAALPSLDSCANSDALLAALEPPNDPQAAARVEMLRQELARAAALEATGQYAEGLRLAQQVRAAAAELGYPPLIAEAALGEGTLLMDVARPEEAEMALREALKLGLANGLDALAAEATARRIFVMAEGLQGGSAALESQPFAEALVERAHDDGRLAALLYNNIGTVHDILGEGEKSKANYMRAIALLGQRAGATDFLVPVVHHNLGVQFWRQNQLDDARKHYSEALDLFAALLGDGHPLGAHPLCGIAEIDYFKADYAAASSEYSRCYRIMETSYGSEHPYLMQPLIGLALVSTAKGERATAASHFESAIKIGERLERIGMVYSEAYAMYSEALVGAAELVVTTDQKAAKDLLARAADVYAKRGGRLGPVLGAVPLSAGRTAASIGDYASARGWFERALSELTGHEYHERTRSRVAIELAKTLVELGEHERACTLAAEVTAGGGILGVEADNVRRLACSGR